MNKILYLIFLISTVKIAYSQKALPVIRAHSKIVDILDGGDFQKGNWNISPEIRPDVYQAERFKGQKRIVFYTDLDSISVTVSPGDIYDFIILLNDKDSAFTRIAALKQTTFSYSKNCEDCQGLADTIPFVLGWNNAIKIKGSINNSEELDMIFDTGANGVVLSDNAYSKNVKVQIDGSTTGFGIGGASTDDLSKSNNITISNITWKQVPLTVKHVGKPNADVVIGYNIFDGKVVEINYDKKIMVIHKSAPEIEAGFSRYDLKFHGGLAFIKLLLSNGKKKSEGWFDFDTGSSTSLYLNNEFATENNLYDVLESIGSDRLKGGGHNKVAVENVILPQLFIANTQLKNFQIALEEKHLKDGFAFNIVGNDVLKRFNAIIDFQNDVVYLKVNSLINAYYLSEKISFIKYTISAFLIIALMFVIIFWYRKRKRAALKMKAANINE